MEQDIGPNDTVVKIQFSQNNSVLSSCSKLDSFSSVEQDILKNVGNQAVLVVHCTKKILRLLSKVSMTFMSKMKPAVNICSTTYAPHI